MSIKVELPKEFFDIGKQLEEVKSEIIFKDVPRILAAEQAKGFPKNKDDYTLFLKSRGKETRRQLSTVRPSYLKIPFGFRFVAKGSMEDVLAAVRMALDEWRKRAPVRSGFYAGSIHAESNNGTSYTARPENVNQDTVFYVTSVTEYSSIIESGFYKKYYKTRSLPSGIGYWVTRKVRKTFGDKVAIRFRYFKGGPEGTYPVIEIARSDKFAQLDVRPGTGKSRRKRRARGRRRR